MASGSPSTARSSHRPAPAAGVFAPVSWRVGQLPAGVDRGGCTPLPEFVPPRRGVVDQVPDGPALRGEGIRDEQAVAAPGHRFTTHDRDPPGGGQLDQALDALTIGRSEGVIGVVLKAGLPPARVDVALDVLPA